jgi:hypothetical protein
VADPIKPDRSTPAHPIGGSPLAEPHELMIPGERDPSTLTHREPGAVGGQFAGADIPSPNQKEWLDDRTAREHAREGGGK